MERAKSTSAKHLGRIGSLGFATLSIFLTSPVFAADIDRGGNRDRQSNEWVKDQKVMRSIATEHQAKKDAEKAAAASEESTSPRTGAECAC